MAEIADGGSKAVNNGDASDANAMMEKREAYGFGLGKRAYSFGLGRKRAPDLSYSFGMGKRSGGPMDYGLALGKRASAEASYFNSFPYDNRYYLRTCGSTN